MGRVKSIAVKVLADELIKEHGDRFTIDFVKNKKVLNEVKKIKSKRVRNILAGYISKKMQQIEKTGV